MNINLGELSKKTGKSEVELAKTIISFLTLKAAVYQQPQRVILTQKGR